MNVKLGTMNPLKLGVGVILVVIGAILMADGIVTVVTGQFLFFPEIHPAFKFIVRFIAVVAATPQMQESKARANC
jgi:UPF0716 family protein affecting phage T7 exclusion